MEILFAIIMILAIGALNALTFSLGAKIGQAVVKGEKIETPTLNPFEAYKKHEAKKEAEKEQEKFDTIMRNIERYDGTGAGQEDIPK